MTDGSDVGQPAWYCIRSKPKAEHIAARNLQELGFEIFLPRIRFKRQTRRGPSWVTEALFPNYLFSRFLWSSSSELVKSARSVSSLVHFGDNWPAIPPETIEELRHYVGSDSIQTISDELVVGDQVQITTGPFQNLFGTVNQLIPGPQRVRILLEFLGRQTSVDIETSAVISTADSRSFVRMDPK